jgi:hypothetical protein
VEEQFQIMRLNSNTVDVLLAKSILEAIENWSLKICKWQLSRCGSETTFANDQFSMTYFQSCS